MENSLVSILIPFKNTADYFQECFDSILDQSYRNWEVLAVDDHSGDESRNIAERFARSDPRIKVFGNNGNGIIPALRTAYSESKGSLITRMDSDDIMTPHKLDVMYHSLKRRGTGHVAVGQVRYFSERGISDGYSRYERWLNELTEKGTNYSEIYKECVIPSPCWMLYREDLDACGAFIPERYPEDYDLTFRFYARGLECIPCDQVLHHWRDYDSRTSRTSEHYAQNYFLDIKLHYFLRLDYDQQRPLTVWGAGTKGKTIAGRFLSKDIPFHWMCDNPKKIGKKIYGKKLIHFEGLLKLRHPQSIITVANEEAQKMIRDYLSAFKQLPMKDYFMFC
jgi:glycosyltransferase involved in cell wall biosynthesis